MTDEKLPEYYQTLFKLITEAVFADGGDGDAFIECKHISKEVVCDAFGEYLKANNIFGLSRLVNENVINYTDMSNENFVFFDEKKPVQIPTWTTIRITI